MGIGTGERRAARDSGTRALERAGFAVTWLDCGLSEATLVPPPCAAPLSPSELVVRIGTAGATDPPHALGTALIDVENGRGLFATVFADRIRALAREADASPGQLLGWAAVHEIGHLLLGSIQHGARGLMRSHWRASEVRDERPRDWSVTPDEASRMRREFASKTRRVGDALADLQRVPALDRRSDS
jgi:hypothetical protein